MKEIVVPSVEAEATHLLAYLSNSTERLLWKCCSTDGEEVTAVTGRTVSYLLLSGSLGTWSALTVLFHSSWSDGWNILLRTNSIKGITGDQVSLRPQAMLCNQEWLILRQSTSHAVKVMVSAWIFYPLPLLLWSLGKLGQGSLPAVFWDSGGPSTTLGSEYPQYLAAVPS